MAENALTIPKESLQRRGDQTGVYVLDGDKVTFRPVTIGAANITRVQIVDGLTSEDTVALAKVFRELDVLLEQGVIDKMQWNDAKNDGLKNLVARRLMRA